jgi:hypothetical protein
MAKQKGIIKLEGTIGDITFFKTQDGYLAREHAPVSAAQIATDPAFQRTRENNAEFGRAGKAGAIFRNAFRQALQNAKDSRVVSRLTAGFNKVIKADQTNPRGLRNVIDGEAELLEGFNCNKNAALGSTLYTPFTAAIDRPTGVCSISLQSFIPATGIGAPSGSTHFKLMAMAAAIDFENEQYTSQLQETAMLPLSTDPVGPLNLSCNLPPAATQPLFLMLGIQFFQQVNGIDYPLKDGGFNALQLVKVSGL